jgi:outer membrane protein W
MNATRMLMACALAVLAPAAIAQSWELGGGLGGSFFTTQDVVNSGKTAQASLSNDIAGAVWLGNSSHRRWGGEVRLDYERGDLKLESGSTTALFPAEVYSMHYDLLFHFRPVGSKVRPYIAGGGGVRFYRGTGTESAVQPLSQFAFLTKTNELKPLISFGAGIKWQINRSLQFRIEAHDFMTTVPTEVIAPAFGSAFKGWFNNIVPMAGLSYTWE